jgi:phage terminase large subunit
LKVDLSNPQLWQKKYLPAITNPKTYNILFGGSGSGKSQQMIQLFLAEIMNPANQNQTFFVIRKVSSTLRNSVIQDFKNKITDWELGHLIKLKISLFEITCGTNRIVFMGCDDPEKLKSLSQAKYIWIEEATELSLEDFTQITLRLRGKSIHQKRFFITYNPISDAHWIKKRFFDKPPEI